MPSRTATAAPADGAIVEFRGFRCPQGPFGQAAVVRIEQDGSPAQVAHWFAAALACDPSPARFAATCLERCDPAWRPLLDPRDGIDILADQGRAHWYRIGLGGPAQAAIRIQCWRCYGQGLGWQRRCGPMPLQAFLTHFAAHPKPALWP